MAYKILALAPFLIGSWLILMSFPSPVLTSIAVKDILSNGTVDTYDDMAAKFGPSFPENGLEGRIIEANPKNACRPISHAPNLTDDYPWIVMIARGGICRFAEKVLHAEKAGFKAAIVYNYQGDDSLVRMGADSKYAAKVDIPSTFIGYTNGMQVIHLFKTHSEYIVVIQEEETIDYRMYLWPFAIVVGLCFIMITLFIGVKIVRERIRTSVSRLSKRHLKKIPIRKFKKGQYYDTCAICLDEYEDGEKIRILPCDHAYHMKCVDPWLTQNKKTCPVCKRRVIPGKDPNSDSDSDDGHRSQERTPLLRAQSQSSHGSINHGEASSSTEGAGSDGVPETIDETQGAVGGMGARGRISGLVQVRVEREIDGGEQREARRPRRERREEKLDGNSNVTDEASEERKTERKEKRRKKKDKKRREERKARKQEADAEESSQLLENQEVEEDQAPAAAVEAEAHPEPTDDDKEKEAAAESYINPSYSESQEVFVPGAVNKREMSEVV